MKKILFLIAIWPCLLQMVNAQQVGVWKIENGRIESPNSKIDTLGFQYWEAVCSILPNDLLKKYVVSLRLFSDGRNEDLGGMNQMDETVDFWQVDLDTADMNIFSRDSIEILDYTHTLIHEFGHLLSLNSMQIELSDDEIQDPDRGYLTDEGYAIKGSYLNLFVEEFWEGKLLRQWDRICEKRNQEKLADRLYQFYLDHSDEFVTDYAAESPEEDIAESWTFFVLSDQPLKSDIKNQKISFFYQFPELLTYREEIRANIAFIPKSYVENFKNK
ncbi:hypothetical protein [Marinifilum caeruleilacunae]|uniref:Zinc-dependent peptidase n=1 Tax=Marinifilum caeruleilacunae TaxID=2499076 RepID=A0ABX1WVN3_9BACT|nr:hypothetical protein [Marinifilum caeruleilacunae]NOU60161.1 hypothetical protein [Marinifilum caeruleilacunae]